MSNLNPLQIFRRTKDSLDNITTSLQKLIGNVSEDSTIQRKIQLFGLENAAADGIITEEELRPVLNSLERINLQSLADEGYIRFNSKQGRFSINTQKLLRDSNQSLIPDLNRDSEFNVRDIQALEFILNFKNKNDSQISLEEQLAAIRNPNLLILKELENAAITRGLRSEPQRFNEFMNKFYDEFLLEREMNRTELTRLLEVFDIFERQDANFDLNQLNYYADLLKEDVSPEGSEVKIFRTSPAAKYLRAFATYEAEAGFTSQHRAGMTELVSRIESSIENNDPRTLRTIDQILRNKTIPLTRDRFTMQNINSFLDKLNDPVEYPKMVINSWADQSIPAHEDSIKGIFVRKMTDYFQSYVETFKAEDIEGLLSLQDYSQKALSTVSRVKDMFVNGYKKFHADLQKINRNLYRNEEERLRDIHDATQRFNTQIEKLDFYSGLATQLRSTDNPNGISQRNLNVIFNYDNHKDFKLTGIARENKLSEYLVILHETDDQGRPSQKAQFLNFIFTNRTLPFSPPETPITPQNIDALLARVENEREFYRFQLEDMATRSNLHNFPAPGPNNIHTAFVEKFMSYKYEFELKNGDIVELNDGQIVQAKYLFDLLKNRSRDSFDFGELDLYMGYMTSNVEYRTLVKFINKLHNLPLVNRIRYLDILDNPESSEEKDVLLRYLDQR
jgi:hypothetical protein